MKTTVASNRPATKRIIAIRCSLGLVLAIIKRASMPVSPFLSAQKKPAPLLEKVYVVKQGPMRRGLQRKPARRVILDRSCLTVRSSNRIRNGLQGESQRKKPARVIRRSGCFRFAIRLHESPIVVHSKCHAFLDRRFGWPRTRSSNISSCEIFSAARDPLRCVHRSSIPVATDFFVWEALN